MKLYITDTESTSGEAEKCQFYNSLHMRFLLIWLHSLLINLKKHIITTITGDNIPVAVN